MLSTELQGNLLLKAKPRPKPTLTLSPTSIPNRERTWIDINPEICPECFTVSKAMIRLPRHHPSIPRECDGTVRFDHFMREFKAKFDGTSQQSITDLRSFWQKEEDQDKVSILLWTPALPSTSCISKQFRDIQEVISLILHCKTTYRCGRTSPSTSTTSGM